MCLKLINECTVLTKLTAMHCAASRGHVTCVAVLLRRGGAEVDSLDKYGCTPLFYAITLDHVDCVRFLLDKYANPNHQDNRGRRCGLEMLNLLS